MFQSTLPRGERLRTCGARAVTSGFNPRSHEESDNLTDANEKGIH